MKLLHDFEQLNYKPHLDLYFLLNVWYYLHQLNRHDERKNFHFLGKAAWRRKNVKGAIRCARKARRTKIDVLGGTRLNFNMGFRFTLDPIAKFHGMVDDAYKEKIITSASGVWKILKVKPSDLGPGG